MIKQFQYLARLWQKVLLFKCSKLSAVTKLLPSLSSTTTSTSISTIFISQRRINQVSKASVYRESVNQLLTRPGLDPDLIKKRIEWRHWEWHNKNARCVRRKCQIFFSGLTHIRLQEWSYWFLFSWTTFKFFLFGKSDKILNITQNFNYLAQYFQKKT